MDTHTKAYVVIALSTAGLAAVAALVAWWARPTSGAHRPPQARLVTPGLAALLTVMVCAFAVTVFAPLTGLLAPAQAAPVVVPVTDPAPPRFDALPAITEDDPRWDCATMGNRVCGPDAPLPAGPDFDCWDDASCAAVAADPTRTPIPGPDVDGPDGRWHRDCLIWPETDTADAVLTCADGWVEHP